MIIDMTTPYDTLTSLEGYLGIYSEDILRYIARNKNLTEDNFIEDFNVDTSKLIEKELYLCCLHVTTNNDNCKSIKEYGLRNLQDSIKLDTSFAKYLNKNGIDVDMESKKINYKGKVFDISSKKNKFGIHQQDLERVHYKFFKDYQINAFFSNDNVLNYGGGVRCRPEILYNLSELLGNRNIQCNWLEENNKCYVIKYKAKISDFTYYTFGLHENYQSYDSIYNEKRKIRWIIRSCINIIHNNNFYDNMIPEIYAYMNFDVVVPYSNIVDIYNEEEYTTKFNIK